MLWVVQNNLYNEEGYVDFINALERLQVDYLIVKPVPFTNKLLPADFDSAVQDFEQTPEPYIDNNQKIIVCGATSLSRVAKAKGWTPGTYLNDNFDFSVWREGFGAENILNGDAVVGKVCDITIPQHGSVFIRPVHDTKAFSGMVVDRHEAVDFLQQLNTIEEEEFAPVHRNTEIMVSSVKKIYAEYRLFVVNGNVVTGSMYKQGNQVIHDDNVPRDVIIFAHKMIGEWQSKVDIRIIPETRVPAKAFVVDIADTPEGMKVIEINNINSSGFYGADVQKIIMAIEDMEK